MSLPVFHPPFPEPKTLDEYYMNHVRMWADYVYTYDSKPDEFEGLHPVCWCYACEYNDHISAKRYSGCENCPILFSSSWECACEKLLDSPYTKWISYSDRDTLEDEEVLEMKKFCLDIANLPWRTLTSRHTGAG